MYVCKNTQTSKLIAFNNNNNNNNNKLIRLYVYNINI